MKIKVNLTLLMLCCVSFFYAQQQPMSCGFDQATKEFLKDPVARKAHEAYNRYAKSIEKQFKSGALSAKMNTTYTIPVVVHVYGRTQHGKTITYQKVKKAIDIVNEDFTGKNPDFNSVDNAFRNRRGTLSIRFALAKLDPNGASTDGVLFHETEETGFGLRSFDNNVKDYAWDNYKYMNVYIMGDHKNDGGSTQSGVAWLPDTGMSNDNLARVVYNGQYLHGNTNTEFASIFTHEFGHWLNLYHTFNGNGCNDPNGDYVSDTPKEDTNATNRGCTVGASECGNLINYENYMGYESSGGCAKMFTQGQVTRMITGLNHPARRTLWTTANLAATGVTLDKAYFEADNTIFESNNNDGSVEKTSYDVSINGGTFALSSGNLAQGTHFNTSLPSGLSVSISVLNNTTIRVSFNGKATSHAISNNGSGSITFNNAAITGGTSSLVTNKLAFNFRFHDPYKVVYNNIADLTARTGAVWQPFTIKESGMNNKYGIFFNGGDLEIESNKQALVMQAGTRNVTLIQANQLISSASNWVNGGVFPNLPDVKTSSYTAWHGRTAYVGFQLKGLNTQTLHGWMRIRVNSNGSEITLLDYAYSTRPNGAIRAGSQTLEPVDPTCNDGIQNGDETGVDCGGSCAPCTTDPTCNDGIQNGDETGIDCGGSCAPCTTDPTCNDGIQNGDETGIDCGGSCEPCNTNVTYCNASTTTNGTLHITNVKFGSIDNTSTNAAYNDFTGQSTNLTAGQATALAVKVNNEHWTFNAVGVWIDWNNNGDFTDSGELVLSKFAAGPYTANVTPPSGAVSNTSLRMRVRIGYGSESKITPCGTDTYIGEVEDYSVRVGGGTTPTCNDGIQNGDETGVDCGGSCEPCVAEPTCTDGIQNGDETGIDCGGSCEPCVAEPTCTDGIQNGDETGIDCGGSCEPCQTNVTYCSATGNGGPEGISNVTFAGINNSSVRNASGYDNFTSIAANVSAGSSHNLRVNIIGYRDGAADEIYAFFDWNQDGDFADTGEKLTLTKTSNLVGDISVAVPSSARTGSTRMRLLVSYYDNESNPCDTGSNDVRYGEYEDYTVNVAASKSANAGNDSFVTVETNPIQGKTLKLEFSDVSARDVSIVVYNANGRRVASFDRKMNSGRSLSVELSNVKSGLYFAKIATKERSNSVKFIVR